jgi:hypothetical protein
VAGDVEMSEAGCAARIWIDALMTFVLSPFESWVHHESWNVVHFGGARTSQDSLLY